MRKNETQACEILIYYLFIGMIIFQEAEMRQSNIFSLITPIKIQERLQ